MTTSLLNPLSAPRVQKLPCSSRATRKCVEAVVNTLHHPKCASPAVFGKRLDIHFFEQFKLVDRLADMHNEQGIKRVNFHQVNLFEQRTGLTHGTCRRESRHLSVSIEVSLHRLKVQREIRGVPIQWRHVNCAANLVLLLRSSLAFLCNSQSEVRRPSRSGSGCNAADGSRPVTQCAPTLSTRNAMHQEHEAQNHNGDNGRKNHVTQGKILAALHVDLARLREWWRGSYPIVREVAR